MQPSTIDWILRNARIADETPLTDIAISGGKISALAAGLTEKADHEWDLAGRVVLPGLIDIHTHLDKTYFSIPNQSGTLFEAIDVWRANKHHDMRNRVLTNARRGLETAIAKGTTAIRSHVDMEREGDLVTLEALLEVKEQFRHSIDLQIVVLGAAGRDRAADELFAEALRLDVDFVGGAPAIYHNAYEQLDAAFALAQKTGKPLDLHIDETEDPTMRTLERLADLTLANGMQGKVSAGHCCSLAFMQDADALRIIDKVARAEINIFTLPACNLVLMGRSLKPAPRGLTRIKELLAHGVRVSAASDNVSDPFNSLGNYDLLHIANLTAHAAHMTGSEEIATCLRMVTEFPAQAFYGVAGGLVIGADADLVVIDSQRVADLVPTMPLRLATFKRGKQIVKTEVKQIWN